MTTEERQSASQEVGVLILRNLQYRRFLCILELHVSGGGKVNESLYPLIRARMSWSSNIGWHVPNVWSHWRIAGWPRAIWKRLTSAYSARYERPHRSEVSKSSVTFL